MSPCRKHTCWRSVPVLSVLGPSADSILLRQTWFTEPRPPRSRFFERLSNIHMAESAIPPRYAVGTHVPRHRPGRRRPAWTLSSSILLGFELDLSINETSMLFARHVLGSARTSCQDAVGVCTQPFSPRSQHTLVPTCLCLLKAPEKGLRRARSNLVHPPESRSLPPQSSGVCDAHGVCGALPVLPLFELYLNANLEKSLGAINLPPPLRAEHVGSRPHALGARMASSPRPIRRSSSSAASSVPRRLRHATRHHFRGSVRDDYA